MERACPSTQPLPKVCMLSEGKGGGVKFWSEQEGGLLEVFWGQNRRRIIGQGDTQMIVLPH